MPIRTNRGRAAVYRRLWGWPLRSPRHLVVTGLGVVVLAIAVAVIVSHANGGRAASRAAASAAASTAVVMPTQNAGPPASMAGVPTTTASPVPVTRLSAPLETPTSAPASPDALAVVDAWGKAWVNHPAGMTNAQWLAQLKPYTTDEFLPQMSTINLSNIAATAVTGPPTVKQSFTSSVEVLLPTNGGTLDITVVQGGNGWQVSTYTEAS